MNGKHVTKLGFEKQAVGLALSAAHDREARGVSRSAILQELRDVQADPDAYLHDATYAPLASHLRAQAREAHARRGTALRTEPLPYDVWGAHLIDTAARMQMDTAMRLPISRAGALMPDAHVGYGLPIGGVLATEDAVIPYGVGVDIGCSMMLSVLPIQHGAVKTDEAVSLLKRHTRFGAGVGFERKAWRGHPVLDERTWQEQGLLRHLHGKASDQIGTSGSGNHFVEFGTFTLDQADLGLEPGTYLAVLSHSGSRGFGAQVAGHYTRVAEQLHRHLEGPAKKLAWLPLDSDDGQGYWQAMNLAGRYALANHDLIHARLSEALGVKPLAQISNSHNLAWKQHVNGQELIVHRKGATPAAAGQLGLIPGSMADPGFVVRGKGHAAALESASHGAGRQLGRKAAQAQVPKRDVQAYLQDRGVTLIGGGIDEAPQAYKRIEDVIREQRDLVDVVGRFDPKVVRMDTGNEDI
ncbi:RtcB family protein [Deinococcus maricopensis]|uniref:3'-phosphate/5'-hydroxy nucleic acid ligase n=1 Tax=Deinococcus maricopensis (strain DSM 21211 / LMG 22137 / NRRL B-23946 / LB-34) TaxID=709986 RepID=E8UBT8_DEIML|nr:RtcB family protein [Deinococcus maricopensis]ADV68527.1 protein of unknown function UPF0027 [Deinococcus maricopensis DSM 21211]